MCKKNKSINQIRQHWKECAHANIHFEGLTQRTDIKISFGTCMSWRAAGACYMSEQSRCVHTRATAGLDAPFVAKSEVWHEVLVKVVYTGRDHEIQGT